MALALSGGKRLTEELDIYLYCARDFTPHNHNKATSHPARQVAQFGYSGSTDQRCGGELGALMRPSLLRQRNNASGSVYD